MNEIITIIEETEGWDDWKDVTIVWPNGEVEVCTFVDWQLWNDEDGGKPPTEGEIVIEHFSREATINWAIAFAKERFHVNCNVVIGTYAT